ncbi:MAG TPA: nucleotidyltransferase family protein [Tepidisphaeraceae bacterium]|nr:nucleotidyltransferase family protein [Tepidisphaeraceae bacterium]
MMTRELIQQKRAAIYEIARLYGASDLRIIGSVARSDATESSDLDLVVRFEPTRTLLDHAGLIGALSDFLGMRVDVVDQDGMRARFRTNVEREAVLL